VASEPRTFTDEQLDRAVEALSDPNRFREAEARVARVAPQLQRILNEALQAGGWFGEAHESQVRRATAPEQESERLTALRTLLAEETRIGMLVGVAVGWELARELELPDAGEGISSRPGRPPTQESRRMPDVEFQANGATAPGYLAVPESGSGPGVVVLQEWWGLEGHIRDMCDRFAAEGFFALAPDLYRGETTEQPNEAEQKMMALSMDQAAKDMSGAVDFLAQQEGCRGDGIGAVGFCLGGGLAVWAATVNPKVRAAVTYYYVMPHGKPDFSKIAGPVLGHFGTGDDFVPVEDAKALEREIAEASGQAVEFHFYEGAGHAFANDHDRLGTYEPEAAGQAWQRTIAFLRTNLG